MCGMLEGYMGDLEARWVAGNLCAARTGQKSDLSPLLPAHVTQRLEKERSIIACKRSCGYSRTQGGKQQLQFIYCPIKQLYSLLVMVTVDSNFVKSVVNLKLSEPPGLTGGEIKSRDYSNVVAYEKQAACEKEEKRWFTLNVFVSLKN